MEGVYPKSATGIPTLNIAFEAAGAAASGIVAGLKAKGLTDISVLAWAGDGGTFDIGIQALSGAAERGTNFIYVCYDNEAYMNTGIQRSGATPFGAITTTTPVLGKLQTKKNMPMIMAEHGIPYVATACSSYPRDLYKKLKKAKELKGGTKYIQCLAPCPPGWRYSSELTIEVGRLAVETGMYVLYEIENGVLKLSGPSKKLLDPEKRRPVRDYIRLQGRFAKMTEEQIKVLQDWVDKQWKLIEERLD